MGLSRAGATSEQLADAIVSRAEGTVRTDDQYCCSCCETLMLTSGRLPLHVFDIRC